MTLTTPRGIPVPESSDPGNIPADFAALASFLDPGDLQAADVSALLVGYRIVFLLSDDGDPVTLSKPPILGTFYFDRLHARLWVPFTQLINGVSTLSWYRIGADTDSEIAALQGDILGLVKSSDQANKTQHADQIEVVLNGIPSSSSTQAFLVGITFPTPFTSVPIVVASNGDTLGQPNVLVGVQNVTTAGFQVQLTRSDVAFHLGDQVLVNYIATANA